MSSSTQSNRLGLFLIAWLASPLSQAACTGLNVNTIGFGSHHNDSNISTLQIASIAWNCDVEYKLALDAGVNSNGGTRRLNDGAGHFISYNLWQDSGGTTTQWGDNNATYNASSLNATSNGNVIHLVYGTATTLGATPPGTYRDTVHVTITYSPYTPGDKLETNLSLSLTLIGTCSINANGVGSFGTWPVGHTDLTNVPLGSLSVICDQGLPYKVGMNAGLHYSSGSRRMQHTTDSSKFVPYTLQSDASGVTPWGDNGLAALANYIETHPAAAVSTIGTGTSQTLYVWGNASIANAPAGTYQDTVTVTVVWP